MSVLSSCFYLPVEVRGRIWRRQAAKDDVVGDGESQVESREMGWGRC
jgi:hypothetical protein